MQFVRCDVATVCMGLAASMGQFLLCAGAPGKRYALPHARILMHQPSAGIQGQAADIAIQAEQIIYMKRMMAERIAYHTGQPSSGSRPTPTATAGSPPRRPRTTGSSTRSSPRPSRSGASPRLPPEPGAQDRVRQATASCPPWRMWRNEPSGQGWSMLTWATSLPMLGWLHGT